MAAGADLAQARLTSILAKVESAAGSDVARGVPVLTGLDQAAALDLALVGFTGLDQAAALDFTELSRVDIGAILDPGAAADRANIITRLAALDPAAAADMAAAGFTPQAAVIIPVTTSGNVTIPPWPRWVDRIALGGGGGGAGGNQLAADGKGGQAGTWAYDTLDRGEGRNTWLSLTVTIGTGGAGGSRNNNGSGTAGGSTTITVAGNTLTAPGGAGGSGTNPPLGSEQPGRSPGNATHQGQTYNGGTGSGNEPGSGGDGGGGSTWPLNSGSGKTGAKGRAWIRLWM
ncbi:glycine-rich domain-containing protein [Tsukamurella ocularis]